MIKYSLSLALLFSVMHLSAQSIDSFIQNTGAFLSDNVEKGLVDYGAIKENPKSLDGLILQVEKMPLDQLSETEKKAFLINAYNLLVIKGIVSHYPSKSPLDIAGFFDGIKYNVGGDLITLNTLEKEHLLKPTGDERLHFVLVCAALSCPPIATFAYSPDKLDNQIASQTKLALENEDFIQVKRKEKKVLISEIFKWYEQDFEGEVSVIQYLNNFRTEKIPDDYKVDYYTYNWTLNEQKGKERSPKKSDEPISNLQAFTPSVLLKKGQVELNAFFNIYTQKEIRDGAGDKFDLGGRQSFFNAQYGFSTGVSKSARFNLGFDILVSSFSDGDSPFSPLFGSGDFNETVLAGFGPSIRFLPFKKVYNLSLRSTFLFPGGKNLENRDGHFVAHDRYTSINQVFYDMELSSEWRLFLEADLIYRFAKSDSQTNFFRTPLTSIISYFPTPKTSIFALYQYSPRYERVSNGFDEQFGLSQWFQQFGFGAKYQLSSHLGIELSYSNFFASRNDGAGTTLNFGLRYIK